MPWENDNNDNNPWGRRPGRRGGSGGGNGQEPDLDEMLRKAQDNLKDVLPGNLGGGKFVGLAALAVLTLWLASGFYINETFEHAVIQRFGEWDRTQTEPGLGYALPMPIEKVTKVNVDQQRSMTIGYVQSGSRNGAQLRDIPEESLMLTTRKNIVDLDFEIQWNIKSAEDYLFEILNQENTIKKVAESAMREVVGQNLMFSVLSSQREKIASDVRQIIQENLDEYQSGVNIQQVLIRQAEVHPDVQSAFQDVQSANQDAEDIQNRAEAYREDILPRARGEALRMLQEAEGYKQSTVAKATGDAERFNAVLAAYRSGEDVTKQRIYLETMENVLSNANKIILDDQGGSGVVPYLPLNELNRNRTSQ
ncbi:MAG: FtsH protease activity modulator HflK [Pseudomonadota bacterium]